MGNSPAVLSVGLRVQQKGFSFIWLMGKVPCLVTPDLEILPLDVVNGVPYLYEHGLHTTLRDPSDIAAACGVCVNESGQLVICSSYLGQFVDSAVAVDSCAAEPEKDSKEKEGARSQDVSADLRAGKPTTKSPDKDPKPCLLYTSPSPRDRG